MARSEQLMKIPAEMVRKCVGFSYDIGGSLMKVIYRTKEDYDEAMTDKSPDAKATVRLVMFSREEMDHGIDFIINNAYIHKGDGEDTVVYTTGMGGYQHKSKLEKELGVKIANLMEMDCFNQGLTYIMTSMTRGEILHPYDIEAMTHAISEVTVMMTPFIELMKAGKTDMKLENVNLEDINIDTMMDDFMSSWTNEGDPNSPMADEENVFPVALGCFGSAFGLLKFDKDYRYSLGDTSTRGGRCCLAMARMLLGCETFEELLALARKGNSDAVDVGTRDLRAGIVAEKDKNDEEGFYGAITSAETNVLCFNFGKGVDKPLSDFKKEDLAAALIRFCSTDAAMLIDKTMTDFRFLDVNHVFLAGGFPANDVTRYWLTRELTSRAAMSSGSLRGAPRPTPYQVHFLKHGPHLGALGCLINSVEHCIKQPAGK